MSGESNLLTSIQQKAKDTYVYFKESNFLKGVILVIITALAINYFKSQSEDAKLDKLDKVIALKEHENDSIQKLNESLRFERVKLIHNADSLSKIIIDNQVKLDSIIAAKDKAIKKSKNMNVKELKQYFDEYFKEKGIRK